MYLYRLNTSAENVRRLLLIYLARINELADRPEFYHLLKNNCTVNIVRYEQVDLSPLPPNIFTKAWLEGRIIR